MPPVSTPGDQPAAERARTDPTAERAVVDLGSAAFWQDPYPVWRDARARGRTAVTTRGETVLLDADDIDAVCTDPAFGQLGLASLARLGITDGPLYDWRALTIAAIDGADHIRLRSVVTPAFNPRRVEPLRGALLDRAREVLDRCIAQGEFDLVATFAKDLPLWLVCRFIGLPEGSYDAIGEFIVGTEEGFTDPLTDAKRRRAEEGIVSLYAYVDDLVADRRAEARDDLISDLVGAQRNGRMSLDELRAMVVNILGGAVGSTRAAISNGAWLLWRHPEQARAVRDDPALLRGATEEIIRYAPPFRGGRRRALDPVERFGVHFAAGDTVYLARQAANRDPIRWEDPDRFDVTRREKRHHSFGYGAHFCLGHALARMDVQVAMQALLERLDDLEMLVEIPERVPFVPDEQLVSLPMRIRRGGGDAGAPGPHR